MFNCRLFLTLFILNAVTTSSISFAQINLKLSKDNSEKFEKRMIFSKTPSSFELNISLSIPKIEVFPSEKNTEFLEFSHESLPFLQNPGEAKVPFIATLVAGHPKQLEVSVIKSKTYILKNSIIAPAQKEDCRCDTLIENKFIFNKDSYNGDKKIIEIQYLGKYRGQDISRVLVKLATSDLRLKETKIFSHINIKITSNDDLNFEQEKNENVKDLDYLIVGPEELTKGLESWMKFKTTKGFTLKTINVEKIQAQSATHLDDLFKNEFKQSNFKNVLIVGDANLVATNLAKTTWSDETQSDYSYFLMDGRKDIIPDAAYGRIVASKVGEVIYQSQKWIEYELEQTRNNRISRMIGIASNEGANPSDEEYVRGIETMLSNKYGTKISHFYQNDPLSNPTGINASFDLGAQWLTYLGHGNGTAWSSVGQYYSVENIKSLKNQNVAKPILIDVACQNGKLNQGYFGERMVNEGQRSQLFWRDNSAKGVAMYYGGSVNISWHPPAIMAQGMISEQIAKKLKNIGSVILAGHLYLMKNYSDINAVKENFVWYHLFGDPGSSVKF